MSKNKRNRHSNNVEQAENMDRDRLELDGKIIDHAHDIFRVEIENTNGSHIVKAKLSGKMRMHKINLEVGDLVRVEVSPFDTGRGRITIRHRSQRGPAVDSTANNNGGN